MIKSKDLENQGLFLFFQKSFVLFFKVITFDFIQNNKTMESFRFIKNQCCSQFVLSHQFIQELEDCLIFAIEERSSYLSRTLDNRDPDFLICRLELRSFKESYLVKLLSQTLMELIHFTKTKSSQ